jgi:hypothetical protein
MMKMRNSDWVWTAVVAGLLGTTVWLVVSVLLDSFPAVLAALFVTGILLGYVFSGRRVLYGLLPVWLGVFTVAPISVFAAAKTAVDVTSDPASDDLWPFLFAMIQFLDIQLFGAVPAVAGALTGLGLARVVKHLRT